MPAKRSCRLCVPHPGFSRISPLHNLRLRRDPGVNWNALSGTCSIAPALAVCPSLALGSPPFIRLFSHLIWEEEDWTVPTRSSPSISSLSPRSSLWCLHTAFTIDRLRYVFLQMALGDCRVRAPLPLNTTRVATVAAGSVIDATKYPDFCVQGTSTGVDDGGAGIEDCLKVNIYAPAGATACSELPVMVYIHGGGYWYGNPRNWPFEYWIHQSPHRAACVFARCGHKRPRPGSRLRHQELVRFQLSSYFIRTVEHSLNDHHRLGYKLFQPVLDGKILTDYPQDRSRTRSSRMYG
ncbi:Alpha/Beta hydrolase protein [Mycena belliarum]|uniref:Alpha/Beta hydrolase protein n=1 Tax=Mycena belliarum TaxID=1033014 RepID=A0AAD6U4U4_9AGAR|nr:Alpha/Beta hydrolase protein [Mycena belliae]